MFKHSAIYMAYAYIHGMQQRDSTPGYSKLCLHPEGEPSDDEEMPGVHCDEEEEGNLNRAAWALLHGNDIKLML